jgi:hypothetical protein
MVDDTLVAALLAMPLVPWFIRALAVLAVVAVVVRGLRFGWALASDLTSARAWVGLICVAVILLVAVPMATVAFVDPAGAFHALVDGVATLAVMAASRLV